MELNLFLNSAPKEKERLLEEDAGRHVCFLFQGPGQPHYRDFSS